MTLLVRTQFDSPLVPDIPYFPEVDGFIEHAVETPDVLFARLEKGYDVGVHLPQQQDSESIYDDFFALADRMQMEVEYNRMRSRANASENVEKNSVSAQQKAGKPEELVIDPKGSGLTLENNSTIVKDE